jgi:hypothetical protein
LSNGGFVFLDWSSFVIFGLIMIINLKPNHTYMELNIIKKDGFVRFSFFIATLFLGNSLNAQTSHVPFPIINLPENHEFEELKKDTVLIVANGYYNTIVESNENLKINKVPGNNLFWEILPLQKGNGRIDIYGVNEKGEKGFLARYSFLIN